MMRIAAAASACALVLAPAPFAAARVPQDVLAISAGFDQHLERRIPAELVFRDETGRAVRLGEYFGDAPVGLVFTYFGCANLCPTVLQNLAGRLGDTGASAARNTRVLAVSIDPLDSPALAQRARRKLLDSAGARLDAGQWHFLTGDQAAIGRLAETAGFRYAYDEVSHQYAHPAGFAVLTPDGRIARYFFGFDFTAAELDHAFAEAGARKVSSPVRRLLLVCFHYDLESAPYSAFLLDALRGISLAALLAGIPIAWAMRRRAHRPGGLEP